MVLAFVQKTVAERIGVEKPKEISLEFSFVEDTRISEDDFFLMLEELEEEMQLDLVDHAWRFETVKNLVDFINKNSKS